MKIYVYKGKTGEGCSTFSADNLGRVLKLALQFKYEICFIDAEQVREGSLLSPEKAKMFVMGGGRFTEVKKALGEQGLKNIQNYTHAGGIYTGICMGSYAAFSDIDFQGFEKRTGVGLNFYNATARGSLSLASRYDGTGDSAAVIKVEHMERDITFPTLYWGGNGMDREELLEIGAKPLSKTYLPDGQEKVMSSEIDVGSNGGKAYACAYHPEGYSWDVIWNWLKGLSPDSDCYTRLYHELMQHPDKAYLMAIACLLDDIALVPDHSFVQQIYPDVQNGALLSQDSKQPVSHVPEKPWVNVPQIVLP